MTANKNDPDEWKYKRILRTNTRCNCDGSGIELEYIEQLESEGDQE